MILKGSQRAGGMQLAKHLMNEADNDHVTLHELRGFIAGDLHGAMKEAYAIGRGTQRCRQFLFSLSLNPPARANVSVAAFEQAISKIEDRLGLKGQPRAIVFHEKEARRHCHAVWLRVDISRMRAINLPYFKSKLCDQSRELFLEHGWQLPKGLKNKKDRDPLNYSLAEWQQSKRTKTDPKVMKELVQSCWNKSDNVKSFQAALEQSCLVLAKGDKRGHVVVDLEGNVFALSRWVGVRANAVREKLGKPDNLPNVDEARAILTRKVDAHLHRKLDEQAAALEKAEAQFNARLRAMRRQQREARIALARAHETRRCNAIQRHAILLPTGLKALWFRVTGQYGKIKQKIEEAVEAQLRVLVQEKEKLIRRQLLERQELQHERGLLQHKRDLRLAEIRAEFSQLDRDKLQPSVRHRRRRRSR